ncbi:MAG: dicarboxylate/amino acid:cation symporter, partial [Bacteroidota bacterium]
MKMKLALHWRILIGMALGVVLGILMSMLDGGKELVQDWIKPFGKIFINALKLIASPLILAALIKGVSDLKDISKLSKMGGRTIAIYLITTIIAVSLGLSLVNLIKPGKSISGATRAEMVANYTQSTQAYQETAKSKRAEGPLKPLEDLVTDNIFASATSNRNMLQVIFFAVFFGIGLILIPPETGSTVKHFFDGFNEVILKMVDLIMLAAPYGVFALLASIVVEAPSIDLFKALAWYSITVIIGLGLMVGFYTLLVFLFTKRTPRFFIQGISPAQLLAFSTSSSAATLPVTMERVTEHLGVHEEAASFVLPIGATINMAAKFIYQATPNSIPNARTNTSRSAISCPATSASRFS